MIVLFIGCKLDTPYSDANTELIRSFIGNAKPENTDVVFENYFYHDRSKSVNSIRKGYYSEHFNLLNGSVREIVPYSGAVKNIDATIGSIDTNDIYVVVMANRNLVYVKMVS